MHSHFSRKLVSLMVLTALSLSRPLCVLATESAEVIAADPESTPAVNAAADQTLTEADDSEYVLSADLAADPAVTITGTEVNGENVEVTFHGPTNEDGSINNFQVSSYYVRTVNGHDYRVEKKSGKNYVSAQTNESGVYKYEIGFPMNMDPSGDKPVYVYVTTQHKDGTTEDSLPYRVTETPKNTQEGSGYGITLSVPQNETLGVEETVSWQYRYAPGEPEDTVNELPSDGRYGITFDKTAGTLVISGDYDASLMINGPWDGYDLESLTLADATFERIDLNNNKPLTIYLSGENEGDIHLGERSDVLITAAEGSSERPSLMGRVFTQESENNDTSSLIMSGIDYAASGEGILAAAGAVAFDGCTVRAEQTEGTSQYPQAPIRTSPTSRYLSVINGQSISFRDTNAEIKTRRYGVYSGNGNVSFASSDVKITHESTGNSSEHAGVYCNKGNVTVEDESSLSVDLKETGGYRIYGVEVGSADVISVDPDSLVSIDCSAGGEDTTVYGLYTVNGTVRIDGTLTEKLTCDCETLDVSKTVYGVVGSYFGMDGGMAKISMEGRNSMYGVYSGNGLSLTDGSLLEIDVISKETRSRSNTIVGVFAASGVNEYGTAINDSKVRVNAFPEGEYAPDIYGINFGGSVADKTGDLSGADIQVGIHESGAEFTSSGIHAVYNMNSYKADGAKFRVRVPADFLSEAEDTISGLEGAEPDIAACSCHDRTIDPDCWGGEEALPGVAGKLTVHVPDEILGKKTLPDKARLLVTDKDGRRSVIWSGGLNKTLTAYSFGDRDYRQAALEIILNGAYETIAEYAGAFEGGDEIWLRSVGDFWYVAGITVTDDTGAMVPPEACTVSLKDSMGISCTVPGFLAEGTYTAVLTALPCEKLYDVAAFNTSSNAKVRVEREGELYLTGLAVRGRSVTVSGSVQDDNGSSLAGVTVTVAQSLSNGFTVTETALTDSTGGYRLRLYGAEAVETGSDNVYSLSFGSYLLLSGGEPVLTNRVNVPAQADGAERDFVMKKMPVSKVGVSWETEVEDGDAETAEYVSRLDGSFTLSGKIGARTLRSEFTGTGNSDSSSGLWNLWDNRDAEILRNGGAELTVSLTSGLYVLENGSVSLALDGENSGNVRLKLLPKAGIYVRLASNSRDASGPYKALWYDSQGALIGVSPQTAIVTNTYAAHSFTAPVEASGACTVAVIPKAEENAVSLGNLDSDVLTFSVSLEKNRGISAGSHVVTSVCLENARFITKPNSGVTAPGSFMGSKDIVQISGHVETDYGMEDAALLRLDFNTGNGGGSSSGNTALISYLTADADGDGVNERYEVQTNGGTYNGSYVDFETTGITLPIDFTIYASPVGTDRDMRVRITGEITADKGTWHDELIGDVTVRRPGMLLEAPARTAEEEIPVKGTAPAGASVDVYDGALIAGSTEAGTDGKWSLSLKLLKCSSSRATRHELYAVSGGTTSESAWVVHSPEGASLKRTGFYLGGKYLDAAGSYMWYASYERSGARVKLEAEFDNPDSLRTDYSDPELMLEAPFDQPVLFSVKLLNGEILYYAGVRKGSTGVFSSTEFTVYSPVVSVDVMYQDQGDVYYTEEGGILTAVSDISEVCAEAGVSRSYTAGEVSALREDLESQGFIFKDNTDPGATMTAAAYAEKLWNDMGREPNPDEALIVMAVRSVSEAVARADTAYAGEVAAADSENTLLVKNVVTDSGTDGYEDLGFGWYGDDGAFGFRLFRGTVEGSTTYVETIYFVSRRGGILPANSQGTKKDEVIRTSAASESIMNLGDDGWEGTASAFGDFFSGLSVLAGYSGKQLMQTGSKVLGGIGMLLGIPDSVKRDAETTDWTMDVVQAIDTPCFKILPAQTKLCMMNKMNSTIDQCIRARDTNFWMTFTNIGSGILGIVCPLEGAAGAVAGTAAGAGGFGAGQIASGVHSYTAWEVQAFQDDLNRAIYKAAKASGNEDCMKQAGKNLKSPYVGQDPSGYVYEAVRSNRLSGVTVTLYREADGNKEKIGSGSDTIFGAENPLTTDKNGHYEWFVPEGRWLVEAELSGYDKTDSQTCTDIAAEDIEEKNGIKWMKVLPPQTEVNLGMTSTEAPYVADAYAASEGVYLTFSKYMDETTLTEEYFSITAGGTGQILACAVEKLNSEKSGDGSKSYASKVLIKPAGGLASETEVGIRVKAGVSSYAGIPMGQDWGTMLTPAVLRTLTVRQGTIRDESLSTGSEGRYPAGTTVTVYADVPAAGLMFERWSATGMTAEAGAGSEYTFIMPDKDVILEAVYSGEARGQRSSDEMLYVIDEDSSDTEFSLIPGESRRLLFTEDAAFCYGIRWEYADQDSRKLVTIKNGVVTAKALKKGVSSATARVNATYKSMVKTFTITVTDGIPSLNNGTGNYKASVNKKSLTMTLGQKKNPEIVFTVPKALRNQNCTVTAQSLKDAVVTVGDGTAGSAGKVVFRLAPAGAGATNVVFTATASDGSVYQAYTKVIVKSPAAEIKKVMIEDPITGDRTASDKDAAVILSVGQAVRIVPYLSRENNNAANITFKSSNGGFKVSKSGLVTAVKPGVTGKVTVKAGTVSETVEVKVSEHTENEGKYLLINKTSLEKKLPVVKTGSTATKTAKVQLKLSKPKAKEQPEGLIWRIDGRESVQGITVSSTGLVTISVTENRETTALPGNYVITVTSDGEPWNTAYCGITLK